MTGIGIIKVAGLGDTISNSAKSITTGLGDAYNDISTEIKSNPKSIGHQLGDLVGDAGRNSVNTFKGLSPTNKMGYGAAGGAGLALLASLMLRRKKSIGQTLRDTLSGGLMGAGAGAATELATSPRFSEKSASHPGALDAYIADEPLIKSADVDYTPKMTGAKMGAGAGALAGVPAGALVGLVRSLLKRKISLGGVLKGTAAGAGIGGLAGAGIGAGVGAGTGHLVDKNLPGLEGALNTVDNVMKSANVVGVITVAA